MKTKMLYDVLLRMSFHARSAWALRDKKVSALFGSADSCAQLYDLLVDELQKSALESSAANPNKFGYIENYKIRQRTQLLARSYLALISADTVVPVEMKFDACAAQFDPKTFSAPTEWERFCPVARAELRNSRKSPAFRELFRALLSSRLGSYSRARINEFLTCCRRGKPIMPTGYFMFGYGNEYDTLTTIALDLVTRVGMNPFITVDEER